ncbi:MAG: NYN domain-containing protein [Desulfomonilaceae bacterium]
MTLIIDGNNLIGRKITNAKNGRNMKKKLVLSMVNYVAQTRNKVQIVFDGIEDLDYPEGIIFKGVQIFYAKPGSTADERIKNMVKNISYARDVTVISSDKELRSYVSHRGAKVMTREAFRSELAKLRPNSETEKKESDPKINNIAEWLEFFGIASKQSSKKET